MFSRLNTICRKKNGCTAWRQCRNGSLNSLLAHLGKTDINATIWLETECLFLVTFSLFIIPCKKNSLPLLFPLYFLLIVLKDLIFIRLERHMPERTPYGWWRGLHPKGKKKKPHNEIKCWVGISVSLWYCDFWENCNNKIAFNCVYPFMQFVNT